VTRNFNKVINRILEHLFRHLLTILIRVFLVIWNFHVYCIISMVCSYRNILIFLPIAICRHNHILEMDITLDNLGVIAMHNHILEMDITLDNLGDIAMN
jgi:hypothetical protein